MHLLLVFLVKPRRLLIRLSAKLRLVIRRPSAQLRGCRSQQPEKGALLFLERKAKVFFGLIVDTVTPSWPNLSCISSLNFTVDYTNAAAAAWTRQI